MGYNYLSSNQNPSSPYSTQKSSGFNIGSGIAPGISYKISKKVLLNASLNNLLLLSFNHNKVDYATSTNTSAEITQNNFGFYSSLTNGTLGNIGIGFSILLNKK
jgi:hypothetical protein